MGFEQSVSLTEALARAEPAPISGLKLARSLPDGRYIAVGHARGGTRVRKTSCGPGDDGEWLTADDLPPTIEWAAL